MTAKEAAAAANAMITWLDSQSLAPRDAIMVLTLVLMASIKDASAQDGSDPVAGARAVGRGLVTVIKR